MSSTPRQKKGLRRNLGGKSVLGILAAVGGGIAAYLWMRPVKAKGPRPTGPLRPPPPPPDAPTPGPAAQRISTFIEGMSDGEIINLRAALPEHWWTYVLTATSMPEDDMVRVAFSPMTIDYAVMSEADRDAMTQGIIGGIGMFNALELQSILVDNGVIPG